MGSPAIRQMAAVTSLGVHTPVALPYLIAEGILPQDPSPKLYQWETYVIEDEESQFEEEVLAAKNAVVWSQGNFIRNIYRFDLEGEDVVQALLTSFPSSPSRNKDEIIEINQSAQRLKLSKNGRTSHSHCHPQSHPRPGRALVVLLKSKAHVYLLKGGHHIVDLPFEVERAFPAPRGLLLQRKRTSPNSSPPTPQLPPAPPNSFFLSQSQPRLSSSYLSSPTLLRSFAATRPSQPSPLGGDSRLESLFQSVTVAAGNRGDDDVTNLYSLSGPLSDLGVVTTSLQHHKPRISGRSQGGLSVEFEGLDPAEKIIYISAKNELPQSPPSIGDLTLLVTLNADIHTVTIWHAWYIDEKSLGELLKQRADQKSAKARRRSSFVSIAATGSATPGVRRRDGTRESFAGPGALHLPGEPVGSQANAITRKPTRQEEEAVMASQMDPDYLPTGTHPPARENRRISSMNTDVRASQMTVNASFGGTGGRRATSFGGPTERRSLSRRKSRGSTPGSAYGRSIGGEDDSMDLDSTLELDDEESVDGILRHIRATFEASGADSLFGSSDEGFKRELVVRKIYSYPIGPLTSSRGSGASGISPPKVVTLSEPQTIHGASDPRIKIYLQDVQSSEAQILTLKVKLRRLWPEMSDSQTVPVPLLSGEARVERCEDISQLQDGKMRAVLLGNVGVQFALDDQVSCHLPTAASYRAHDPLPLLSHGSRTDKEIGRNRLLDPPVGEATLQYPGFKGRFDYVAKDGIHHRRQVQLRPSQALVDEILSLCEVILPRFQARAVRGTWCKTHAWLSSHKESTASTSLDIESIALAATIFTFAAGLNDAKARAVLSMSRMTAGDKAQRTLSIQSQGHGSRLFESHAWSWMPQKRSPAHRSPKGEERRKDQGLIVAAALADELSGAEESRQSPSAAALSAVKLMLALHMFREERKLCVLSYQSDLLAPIIAQLGSWLGLDDWGPTRGKYYELEGAAESKWAYLKSQLVYPPAMGFLEQPIGVFQWFESVLKAVEGGTAQKYPQLAAVAQIGSEVEIPKAVEAAADAMTSRLTTLSDVIAATNGLTASPTATVEVLVQHNLSIQTLDTFPESIAAPFKEAIARCEKQPPTTWSSNLLQLVGREDLIIGTHSAALGDPPLRSGRRARDMQTACNALDHTVVVVKTKEADRHSISQLIFSEDRRMVDATIMMHFSMVQIGQCVRQPDWDEQTHFEHQRRVMHWVSVRMIALPAGDGMLHYDSQTPLLTEKYHLPGFTTSCLMQPMNHHLTIDRTGLTEEKVNWAYFHAGVSSGLRISRSVTGIDTSWIAFNKPAELTNRHAGLLLALGLGGHLRNMAKWLSFKYLTPKHTMTSVGLLLGLSASYIGTMDGLITRMLSVHITRMLPAGAAELNVSPATQTAGLMGIGLLYYNTQHRRMSEIMLSELEYMEVEDPDSGPDQLRDESYRLSAGFALGLINLAKGNDLRGLHGMQLPERLLAVAVGPRPVNAVHVFDRATAGAVVAIALVYMKTNDKSIARKIDIPDTEAQFDHVRPDVMLLRAMAKHIILWDDIVARGPNKDSSSQGWIQDNLPACYRNRSKIVMDQMARKRTIDSAHIPLFNIFTGLAWALALKYAGTGSTVARDEILEVLKFFHALNQGADAFYFDGKLGRASLRRCMDVLALCAAIVMAGTGDLETFRFLRRMHGRTDADTPYGSHFAAHLAIGTLFLAGGTMTFGTSNLAVASLMIAFYPLFPTDVHDNRVHLQAFRHLWVFAAEARCLVVEDIDTQRPIHVDIVLSLKDGSQRKLRAPCLLPDLADIKNVRTDDKRYWPVTLDFEGNAAHVEAFRRDPRVFVRRCPAKEAHSGVVSASLAALNAPLIPGVSWHSLFKLKALEGLDKGDGEGLLPAEVFSRVYVDGNVTGVGERLALQRTAREGRRRDELWNLRLLFAWAERERRLHGDGKLRWLGEELLEGLKGIIAERSLR